MPFKVPTRVVHTGLQLLQNLLGRLHATIFCVPVILQRFRELAPHDRECSLRLTQTGESLGGVVLPRALALARDVPPADSDLQRLSMACVLPDNIADHLLYVRPLSHRARCYGYLRHKAFCTSDW